LLAELRERAPIRRVFYSGLTGWLVTRAEDISAVLADPRVGNDMHNCGPGNRNQAGGFGLGHTGLSPHMSVVCPPDHTQVSPLVGPVFTVRRIEALRPMVQRTADELISAFLPRGEAELMAEFAWPFPASVISQILGVPLADRAQFSGWVHGILGPGT